ncbi:FliM/FliN family flagellar motor C-terminal domain-containing protein [Roseibacterium beibuensis]|uniref:Flagellar motor switch protein FliN-like C-terminal domain-containing protein n=1 Tax=[Roseibacterium] beibuensis TaxID=1193142 RepID=A0ABP9LE53_9RHOB|nr:FliM/FliN family flagellar motor C-terminal domain-containing protein [Roseibacterium beibuensis]MCS6626558.1 FliM/FliN family flagellar motor C-terminal domain-containing protein [Roseibacterium beibuensis]
MTTAFDPIAATRAKALHGLPIEIRVCVGRARPRLGDMMSMAPDTVLPLDSRIEDKVGLYVGDKLIAEGDLVELDGDRAGQLAVRITGLPDRGDAPE